MILSQRKSERERDLATPESLTQLAGGSRVLYMYIHYRVKKVMEGVSCYLYISKFTIFIDTCCLIN